MSSAETILQELSRLMKERQAEEERILAQVGRFADVLYDAFQQALATLKQLQTPDLVPAQRVEVHGQEHLRFGIDSTSFAITAEPRVARAPEGDARLGPERMVGRILLYVASPDGGPAGPVLRVYQIAEDGAWTCQGFGQPMHEPGFDAELLLRHVAQTLEMIVRNTAHVWRPLSEVQVREDITFGRTASGHTIGFVSDDE